MFLYILILIIFWDGLSEWAEKQGWDPGVAAIVGGIIILFLTSD